MKQKRTRVTASRRVCTTTVGMIYDRRELSFRWVDLYHDANEPHFRSPLVHEVNCLKWPVHSGLFPKFRMLLHFLAEICRSSNSEKIGGSEIFCQPWIGHENAISLRKFWFIFNLLNRSMLSVENAPFKKSYFHISGLRVDARASLKIIYILLHDIVEFSCA